MGKGLLFLMELQIFILKFKILLPHDYREHVKADHMKG